MSQENIPAMSEDRYRLLVEAVTDYAIYMLDPTGVVSSWNPGAQRFKGYRSDEIIGQNFSTFYTDEDRESGLPEHALATAAREGRFENEGWRVRKDGTRFWAFVVIDPIRSPTGELLGFAKVTRDLTERKMAEAKVKLSEEQFRLLVQGVTDYAIFMLDTEGNISNWNQGAQRIKGYSATEIIGTHFSRFYTEEDRAHGEPERALRTAREEGKIEREGWRVRKDGSRFWAHVVIDPLRDDMGTIIGYAKITRDVTERREAQLKLDKTREALGQSQKMEAIGHLTGGIAHDFNNLLMAVLSSLELIRKRLPNDAKLTALLDNAMQGAQRGAVLTKRMLAFARRQELNPETIVIPDLVRGMSDMLERSLGQSISIDTHFPLKLSSVVADANQLEMALLNLSVNARDAMPGGGKITIAARNEKLVDSNIHGLREGSYVCLSLTDTGHGMDADTLRHATEPFFTTKGPGKGTGLGLPMVHGLAEQFGGRFELKSQLGKGTIAEIWLPAAAAVVSPPRASPPVRPAERFFESLVVMTVDDDPLVLTNTVAMLEDLGHTTIAASSGGQALDLLRGGESVDLVITDQLMPDMTGSELAVAIHAELPKLPVVVATGFAEMPPNAPSLPRLAKPFTQSELADKIASLGHPKKRGRLVRLRTNDAPPFK